MSLAAGPGRASGQLPDELKLAVEKHVAYIQSLDTVRADPAVFAAPTDTDRCSSAAMSSNTTSPNTCD